MTRYFYTDPLAAAWMAKHFQMQIGDYTTSEETICFWGFQEGCNKFYIYPDSLSILQPQGGDLIEVTIGTEQYTLYYYSGGLAPGDKIIQRNGKQFFWPEVEE